MKDFPEFMKSPANLIGKTSQYTDEIEGYVFNGADGSQMAFWTCYQNRDSKEHTHDFDEYFVVIQGQYTVIIGDEEKLIEVGQECHIPKGAPHSGRAIAGTRTIHCFGGKRV
jgi:mannose-6-phosphate isomerase-like protein (cupin superfamily)